ncbi:DPP IV N-terminal domain-containing protein [Streptosporangium sp. NPDC004631]
MAFADTDLSRFRTLLGFADLVRGGRISPLWHPDGRSFSYLDDEPGGSSIVSVDPATGERRTELTIDSVRGAVEREIPGGAPATGLRFERLRAPDREGAVEVRIAGTWFRWPGEGHEPVPLSPAEQQLRHRRIPRVVREAFLSNSPPITEVPSPDGQWLATERGDDLWLRSPLDDRAERLTSDGEPDFGWKVDGASWSPDGLRLAARRVDTRAVRRIPVVHWLKPVEDVEWAPYTKSGGPYPRSTLHIIDVLGRRAIPVDVGDDEPYFVHPLRWLPSGELLVLTLDRTMKALRLLAADRATGRVRTVVEERQDSFVIGIRQGMLESCHLVDGDRLLWASERDGWRHFYLYSLDGTLHHRVTSGEFEVDQVVGVDTGLGVAYVLAHSDPLRPYDVHVCRVGLDGTGFRQLTGDPGMHSATLAPAGDLLVDTHSSLGRPPRTDLLRTDGRLVATLATADVSEIVKLGWEPPEEFTALAADGRTVLHGVLWKPPGFDPSKRYPVVEYIYAGPQMVCHPRDFAQTPTRGIAQALARLGFVTYIVDGRGTPERGKAFQDVVYGRFGQYEIDDHRAVLRGLGESRQYLDLSRVGVVGGSWGGYMTVRALLTAPDDYHVGCALYLAGDLVDHIALAIEPYMGLIQDDPDGYRRGSLLPLAERLRGHLLLIHGTSDVNGSMSGTMKLVDAFARADRPVDLLVLPELDHSLNGYQGAYALGAIGRYLVEHLRPESG